MWRALRHLFWASVDTGARLKSSEEDTIRRYAEALLKEGALNDADFPTLQSRIPYWIPDWLLAITLEPLEWFAARRESSRCLRYRSREMTAVALRLNPDIIHCHDCMTLPARLAHQEGARHPADLRRP